MIKKFTLLLLAMLCIAGTSKADDDVLNFSDLTSSGSAGNTQYSGGTLTFVENWDDIYWDYSTSPKDCSSYNVFQLTYTASDESKDFRIYFEFGNKIARQEIIFHTKSTSSETITMLLNTEGKASISKIGITSANAAFTMSGLTAKFTTVSSIEMWSGSHAFGSGNYWDNPAVQINWQNKLSFSESRISDKIKVTFSSHSATSELYILEGKTWAELPTRLETTGADPGDTKEFEITTAANLEKIQEGGIVIRGKNATITNVELVLGTSRTNQIPISFPAESDVITFSNSLKNLDLTGVTGIEAYYANNAQTGSVSLTKITYVPYNNGVILKRTGDAGETRDFELGVGTSTNWAAMPDGNKLLPSGNDGTNVARSVEGKYHYIFAKHGSDIGFYLLGSDYYETYTEDKVEKTRYAHLLAAHKAYLETATDLSVDPPASPKSVGSKALIRLSFGGGEGTTAINTALKNPIVEDGLYYTLQGVAVKNPSKGIYILNGKKVFVK